MTCPPRTGVGDDTQLLRCARPVQPTGLELGAVVAAESLVLGVQVDDLLDAQFRKGKAQRSGSLEEWCRSARISDTNATATAGWCQFRRADRQPR